MQQNVFGAGLHPELTALPRPRSWIRGKGRKGKDRMEGNGE